MQNKINISFTNDDIFKRLSNMKLTIMGLIDNTLKIFKAYLLQQNMLQFQINYRT